MCFSEPQFLLPLKMSLALVKGAQEAMPPSHTYGTIFLKLGLLNEQERGNCLISLAVLKDQLHCLFPLVCCLLLLLHATKQGLEWHTAVRSPLSGEVLIMQTCSKTKTCKVQGARSCCSCFSRGLGRESQELPNLFFDFAVPRLFLSHP